MHLTTQIVKLIPGSNNYFINLKTYIISDNIDYVLKSHDVKNKDEEVGVCLYGHKIRQTRKWFYHLAITQLFFYESISEKAVINLEFVDFRKHKSKRVLTLPLFKSPIELIFEGTIYRVISTYPNYIISDYGDIRTIKNKEVKTYNGDYKYAVISDKNEHYSVYIHRLVAIAWVPNEDFVTNNLVDHKDGNKFNNHQTNLQWVTNSQNVGKGIHNTECANPIIVRDIDKGQINHFPSITAACEYIGRSRINTKQTLLKQGRVWKGKSGRYEIYKKDQFTHWSYEKSLPQNITLRNSRILVTVNENNIIKKFTNYESFRNEYLNIRGKVSWMKAISLFKRLHPSFIISYEFIKTRTIEVYDCKNNRVLKINSMPTLYTLMGMPKSTVIKYLATGVDNRLIHNRYQIRYETDSPWPETSVSTECGIKIQAKTKEETKIYESLRKAEKDLKINRNQLLRLAKNKKSIHASNGIKYSLKLV